MAVIPHKKLEFEEQPSLPPLGVIAALNFPSWQDQCAFNGAWGGGSRHPTAFYVSSYFWDRATDAGIIGDENALTWDLKPADLITAATKACGTPVSGLAAAFPKVRPLLISVMLSASSPWP